VLYAPSSMVAPDLHIFQGLGFQNLEFGVVPDALDELRILSPAPGSSGSSEPQSRKFRLVIHREGRRRAGQFGLPLKEGKRLVHLRARV